MPVRPPSLLAALVLAACSSAPPAAPPAPPAPPVPLPAPPPPPPAAPPPPLAPLSELSITTHTAFFTALRAHDDAALAKLYAPDAGVYLGLGVAEVHGPDAVAAVAKTFFRALPDARVQWSLLLQSRDVMAVELTWTGTHTGALLDMHATRKIVGSHALLVERFSREGLIQAQHLYFDADPLASDLGTRGGKPHNFEGLPTSQTSVLEHAVTTPEDDVGMRALAEAFAHGSFVEARALGALTCTWTDVTKGRTVTGKGAAVAWTASLERLFKGGGAQLIDVWSVGDWIVFEWSGSSGGTATAAHAHAGELVRFEQGKVAEIRSYRSAVHPERAKSGG